MKILLLVFSCALWSLMAADAATKSNETAATAETYAPHTPTLIFYLTEFSGQQDVNAVRNSVQKLQGATTLTANTNRSYVRIRFDSHVVSYHQVAQAIGDAGKTLGKSYDPYLVFSISEYARLNNTAKVDAIFAGKRLNTRVTVKPLDKIKGEFSVHFLPLKVDPKVTAPQGFNGGHLHHPISDPPPRGLGLTSDYMAVDELPAFKQK
jgi:hypothetical protein